MVTSVTILLADQEVVLSSLHGNVHVNELRVTCVQQIGIISSGRCFFWQAWNQNTGSGGLLHTLCNQYDSSIWVTSTQCCQLILYRQVQVKQQQ